MRLKLDDKGAPVLSDGKPVYMKDDGSEVAFDAAATVATISRLNGEAKGWREKYEAADSVAKKFEGLDPSEARKAVETFKNLDSKKLIDAGEAEKAFSERARSYEAKLAENTKALETLQSQLHAEKIGGAFSRSKFIAEKVAIPSDLVQAAFGSRFSLKDGKVLATDANGNTIYSASRPGEPADFDEALEALVSSYPNKDAILKSTGSTGSDKRPNMGSGGNKTIARGEFEKLDASSKVAKMKDGFAVVD